MSRSTGTPKNTKQQTTATYNAAADVYDHPANSFWDHFGQRTVERLNLPTGGRVLDVCCGSGASAIPAARSVGTHGFVVGVDLAENLLQLARTKASREGMTNIEFRQGDLRDLDFQSESFDAVICIFGIFFLPDMQSAVNELWRLVKLGGTLSLTTWGPRFFEPGSTAFWNSIRTVRPDLYKTFNPWDRISEPDAIRLLLNGAGAETIEITTEEGTHPVNSPEDWWTMILGTGYRGTITQLDAAECETVRRENLDFIRNANVRAVEANVLYGVARKAR